MDFMVISPYVFNTSLTWYSVFILMGALLTYFISNFLYKKEEESKKCPDLVFDTFLIAFPMGLVGARIWYVLSDWEYYSSDPISILRVWEGGLAIQGGVILGIVCGVTYAIHKMRKHGMNMSITRLMDLIIPNILIAQVIGRWGNFFNREVYGACTSKESLWFLPSFILDQMEGEGFYFSNYAKGPIACAVGEYAQPLFLYEGLLNLIGFILITVILRKYFNKRIDGTLSALYLVWYGVVRACLEGLRNESFIMRWGNVSQSLVTSIAFVFAGIAMIALLYVNKYKKDKLALNAVKNEVAQEDINIEDKDNGHNV